MKILMRFEEFVSKGVVFKRTPENSRALFLFNESQRKYGSLNQILDKIGINELNAHEIIEYGYDILVYLLRSKLFSEGFSSTGEGAHEVEVSYMRNLGFSENDVLFMNQLRYLRNGIKYYGKILDKEYAEKVMSFLNRIYPRLLKLSK
ncbi:MAG: hypothetical protein AABY22_21105 [Nanoarchaeota archaeon]